MVTVKLFKTYASLIEWRDQQTNSIWVAENTPLLSNLNMLENIALMDEVHKRLRVKEAENKALKKLTDLGIAYLALKRLPQCNDQERFQVMLLRAITLAESKIFVLLPLSLISHEDGIKVVLNMIEEIDTSIQINILDLESNLIHYQGQACHINE